MQLFSVFTLLALRMHVYVGGVASSSFRRGGEAGAELMRLDFKMSSLYYHIREIMDYNFNVTTINPEGLHRTPLEDRRCSVSPFLLTLYPDPEVGCFNVGHSITTFLVLMTLTVPVLVETQDHHREVIGHHCVMCCPPYYSSY
ncbi:hypothetical protein CHARACLAT_032329 [Characodon lateralis]|uniref:Uncharacterized protein n=1 Tax=Characodon lateralis TaxID=208331 RepID=A0ABU7F8V8_9TELE|nr:hypothetical protein [Characodon lateralis]